MLLYIYSMKYIFYTLLCLLCLNTHAQKLLLEGTIGKHAILIELDIMDNQSYYGRYFYKSSLLDIQVNNGKASGSNISLLVYKRFDDELLESFTLVKNSNTYTGTWKDELNGSSLPVQLKPVDFNKPTGKYDALPYIQKLKAEEPYTYIRLNNVQTVSIDSVSALGKYSLQWLSISKTNLLHFKVIQGYDSITMNRINNALVEEWLIQADGYFSCTINGEKEIDYHAHVKPTFINEHYVSYAEENSWYCGGAHPENAYYGGTIDIHTGKKIEIEDILWLADWPRDTSLPESEYNTLLSEYRSDVLAPAIVSLLAELYPDRMGKPATDEDCDYSNPEFWGTSSFYLTPIGLYVGPYFYRVYRGCDMEDWSVIPYSRLRWLLSNEVERKLPK